MKPTKLYSYLISNDAFVLDKFTNDAVQDVVLVEHPIYGDSSGVIVMFPKYAVAFETDFFDIDDLTSNGDYQPLLFDDQLKFAFEVN